MQKFIGLVCARDKEVAVVCRSGYRSVLTAMATG